MASFSSTIYNDRFFLILPLSRGRSSFWGSITKPFDPFTPDLWAIILSVFSSVGIVLSIENHEGPVNWWNFVVSELPGAMLRGLNAIAIGEVPGQERQTSGSWLTGLFLGFTFQVLVTGYTAVVTTTLMEQVACWVDTHAWHTISISDSFYLPFLSGRLCAHRLPRTLARTVCACSCV